METKENKKAEVVILPPPSIRCATCGRLRRVDELRYIDRGDMELEGVCREGCEK